jgi:hypothetical protein
MEAGFGILELIRSSLRQVKKEFDGTDEEFQEKIKSKFPELLTDLRNTFSQGLITFYKTKILDELRQKESDFNERLFNEYKEGFDYLQIFIDLNKYLGKQFLNELEGQTPEDDKLKLNVLFRLHGRACQVATEIQTLLKFGYSDGAHARWRTLHEISVIFNLLIENDNLLTEMFVNFEYIEKLKRAKNSNEHLEKINWRPIDDETISELEQKAEVLKNRYGNDFAKNYGWTLNIIPNGRDRNFKKIEELVGLDYLRPFYSWACENVHSGMDGVSNRMSLHDSSKVSYLMFSGPSQYGLADPAQFTTYSLILITSSLISLNESYENLVVQSLLEELHELSASEFFKKHIKIKEELKKYT